MKEDLRISKTYESLSGAFIRLLKKKSFSEITVKSLCEEAKTRTATFYSHFSDKYDFFAFLLRRVGSSYLGKIESIHSLDKKGYIEAFVNISFDMLEENADLFASIFNDDSLSSYVPFFSEEASKALEGYFRKLLPDEDSLTLALLPRMFVGAMAETSQWWFPRRNEYKKEDIIKATSSLLERLLP